MDLNEWEILPADGLLDYKQGDDDDDDKAIISTKPSSVSDTKIIFDMNYFLCPSMETHKINQNPGVSRIPFPLQLDSPILKVPDNHQEISELPVEISVADHRGGADVASDQESVTQVFFKKMTDNEFDMKMDSPRSCSKGTKVQIDVGNYQFVDEAEAEAEAEEEDITKSPGLILMGEKGNMEIGAKDEMNWEVCNGGLNIFKWSLNGIGAICSFGFAVATVCILFYGGQEPHQHHQRLRFQIHTNKKKLKRVVQIQDATRLNEAILARRGLPLTRAQITCGGYYDGRQRS